MSLSLCRENFAVECENALNSHITLELYASQTYLAMYAYFSQDSVALHGFAKYFKHESEEERKHATEFIQYLSKRGGKVGLQVIEAPPSDFVSPLKALEASLACFVFLIFFFEFFL